jgi:hypothetical protein
VSRTKLAFQSVRTKPGFPRGDLVNVQLGPVLGHKVPKQYIDLFNVLFRLLQILLGHLFGRRQGSLAGWSAVCEKHASNVNIVIIMIIV